MAGGPENAGRKANNHTAGGLRRGQPLHSEVPTSSIPTSRVAVLRAEAPSKDREAFNSRTERSLSLTANEIAEYPSPTMYSPVPSRFERQASASFSERGYGAGFASKTSRFARRRGGRAPGPGKYTKEETGQPHVSSGGRVQPASPSFAKQIIPISRSASSQTVHEEMSETPAPTQYTPRPSVQRGAYASYKSSFRSSARRTTFDSLCQSEGDAAPPPGAYYTNESTFAPKAAHSTGSNKGGKEQRSNQRIAMANAMKLIFEDTSSRKELIGPGSYEAGVTSWQSPSLKSAFSPGKLDRAEYQAQGIIENPGPGAHDAGTPRVQSGPDQTSPFKSAVHRDDSLRKALLDQPPGPAYYAKPEPKQASVGPPVTDEWK